MTKSECVLRLFVDFISYKNYSLSIGSMKKMNPKQSLFFLRGDIIRETTHFFWSSNKRNSQDQQKSSNYMHECENALKVINERQQTVRYLEKQIMKGWYQPFTFVSSELPVIWHFPWFKFFWWLTLGLNSLVNIPGV